MFLKITKKPFFFICISTHQHFFNNFCNWLLLNNHNQPRKQPQTSACKVLRHSRHTQITATYTPAPQRASHVQLLSNCLPARAGELHSLHLVLTERDRGFICIPQGSVWSAHQAGGLVLAMKTSSRVENTKSRKSGMFASYCIAPHYSELMSKT